MGIPIGHILIPQLELKRYWERVRKESKKLVTVTPMKKETKMKQSKHKQ